MMMKEHFMDVLSYQVKERRYEKVGEDFEQVHDSYRKFHPAFVENW